MNKIGGEKIISVWWFAVLAIIGAGIVAGVLIFYSAEVDVREAEADIFHERIINCITEQGFLIEEFLGKDFDIYEICNLNKEVIDGGDFYFKISSGVREDIVWGNTGFWELRDSTGPYIPKFVPKTENVFYYRDGEINEVEINILTASNQNGRKISVTE